MSDPSSQSINNSGMLEVGEGHEIYWEDWGNSDATPILHVHGGPGGRFTDKNKLSFNPAKHRVIFYDQRGCGRSTPFAETANNTTEHLIADIEKLRAHLGIEKFHLFGGSWGSALSLIYAIKHPERVLTLLMWGIYLARPFENDLIAGGYGRYNYPEAWERFIELVPEDRRLSGDDITRYYAEQLESKDEDHAQMHADEWTLWESTLVSINYNKAKLEQETIGEDSNLPLAKLETQYFLNGCYISDNFILDNIHVISHIPCYVVQGRFDNCTPPISAYQLEKAYGDNMSLQIVNAGHIRYDSELFAALVSLINIVYN